MQISTNGLILFDYDDQFQSYALSVLPRRTQPYLPIIAPLWADFNFRDSGNVFYRLTTDSETLERVSSILKNLTGPSYSEFSPNLAVIVTWFQSKLLRSEMEVSTVEIWLFFLLIFKFIFHDISELLVV